MSGRALLVIVPVFVLLFAGAAAAQKKTFILVRHAEKDTSPTADKKDPELTEAGRARAERLRHVLKRYKPDEIFASEFNRTRATAEPTAAWRRRQIQAYNIAGLNELAEQVLASKAKRTLIVGHNTTTPALANILIGSQLFKAIPDDDYGKIFIVQLRDGRLKKAEIIEY